MLPRSSTSSLYLKEPLLKSAAADKGTWTVIGIIAISVWTTAFAGARITGKAAGSMTSMGFAFLIGGLVASAVYAALGKFRKCVSHPRSYYLQCGIPFTMYPVCLFLGFHFASTDIEIIVLTVINYLWPHIMSVLLVVIFRKPWKWTLIPGILGAVCMVFLTTLHLGEAGNPLVRMLTAMLKIWPAALSTFAGACCWASYSAWSSKYAQECRDRLAQAELDGAFVDPQKDGTLSAVPFLTAVTGIVLLTFDQLITEAHPGPFDISFYEAMLYMTVVPTCGCRFAWDFALGRGDPVILNAYAYLTPFIATIWNILLLGTPMNPFAMVGSAGLAICAVVVKKSILA